MGKKIKEKKLGKNIIQRPDGKYVVRFRKKGKSIYETFSSLSEAQRFRNIIDGEFNKNGVLPEISKLTVNQWCERWVECRSKEIAPSTMKGHQSRYRTHIQGKIGHMRIRDVKSSHCQDILSDMAKKYKKGTIKGVRSTLSSLFKAAEAAGEIYKSPVTSGVEVPTDATGPKPIAVPDEMDLLRFLDAVTGTVHEAKYRFALETGLRIGELTGLRWSDVDLERREIRVCQQWSYAFDPARTDSRKARTKDLSHWHHRDQAKTEAGGRRIPLTDEAIRILSDLRAHSNVQPDTPEDMRNLVFLGRDGWPTAGCTCDAHMHYICKKNALPHMSMHTLRHVFASRAVEKGVDIDVLSKIMGHRNAAITMALYVHASDSRVKASTINLGINGVKLTPESDTDAKKP